jgi:hypothetical protein
VSLEGSIKTIGLPDVLTLLASTSKSGELQVHTERREGRLWFDGGRLSGHEVAHCPDAVDALFELLRGEDGTFTFTERAEGTGGDLAEVAALLTSAQERLEQWREIAAVVPSVSHRVGLVEDPALDRVELDKAQWALVLAVAEGQPVRVILDRRRLGEFEGCREIKELVEMGLAIIEEGAGMVPAMTVLVETSDLPRLSETTEWSITPSNDDQPNRALLGSPSDQLLRAVADAAALALLADETGSEEDLFGHIEGESTEAVEEADSKAVEGGAGEIEANADDEVTPPYAAAGAVADGDESPVSAATLQALLAEAVETATADTAVVEETHHDASSDEAAVPAAHDEPVADDHDEMSTVDGAWLAPGADEALDDRGPWTSNELEDLDRSGWRPEQTAPAEDGAETASEGAEPAEEPINRGLLLKFLSSVRN